MTFLLINLFTLLLILFIIWWFWIYKPKVYKVPTSEGKAVLEIVIKGGVYHPAMIQISEGQALELTLLRKDPSKCAEMVIFPDLNLSVATAFNETVTLDIPPQPPGTYLFTCEMGMYRGKLIVR